MKRALCLACVAICMPGIAQQGHPPTGTWSGDWGATPAQRIRFTLVMNWDGKNVTGLIKSGAGFDPANKRIGGIYSKWTGS